MTLDTIADKISPVVKPVSNLSFEKKMLTMLSGLDKISKLSIA